jgi:hypothetical protein
MPDQQAGWGFRLLERASCFHSHTVQVLTVCAVILKAARKTRFISRDCIARSAVKLTGND